MSDIRELKFEPGAMSIIQMGEEQIGHPSTAINELVKNSYDADADECRVYTHYDKITDKSFLIIQDNGLGMDASTLFGDWLRPSISSKRDEDKAKRKSEIYERLFLGSKGIGRLAAMALGRYLTVISKKDSDKKYNWLRIDRESFRVESLLDKIFFPGGEVENYISVFREEEILKKNNLTVNEDLINLLSQAPFNTFNEGTLIIMQYLDDSIKVTIEDEFNQKDIEETSVFKSLRDLITPLKLNIKIQDDLLKNRIISEKLRIDNGEGTFQLSYGINFLNESSSKIIDSFIPIEPSEIIEQYDYRVFGKVNEDSSVNGQYLCKRFEDDTRNEDFILTPKFILSDEDLNKRQLKELDIPDKYKDSNVGVFYFDIRVYDLDADVKDKMVKIFKASGRRESTKVFNKYLGLKISKNGFGVKPYGEEEQDWLGLGAKRVSKHIVTIGPNQIIGYVYLHSPQNDGLSEKTNREGFFENKAFVIFKKILSGILEEMGRRRAKYRAFHNLGRRIKSKHERPETEKFVQYLLDSSEDPVLIKKAKEFIAETNTVLDNMENSLSFSQRLATLGTGIELIYHELSQPITSLGGSRASIEINVKKISNKELREVILKRLKTVESSIDFLDTLKESLRPAIGKSVARLFKPISTFKKVCFLFESDLKEKEIVVEIKKNAEDIEIKGFEYVFWISFLNILNNAIYWLSYTDKKKVIIFEYEEPNTFIISNTSPKIPEGELDVIFEYGITSKKEKDATGLGLAFTRNMLTSKGWDIWAENREYGSAFYIKKA